MQSFNKGALVALIFVAGSTALKADRFPGTFEKPYRQNIGLAASGALLLGGGYKLTRLALRSPRTVFTSLFSLGAMGAGTLGTLIAEGNSDNPKFITEDRWDRFRFGFGRPIHKVVSAFDAAVTKAEPALNEAHRLMNVSSEKIDAAMQRSNQVLDSLTSVKRTIERSKITLNQGSEVMFSFPIASFGKSQVKSIVRAQNPFVW